MFNVLTGTFASVRLLCGKTLIKLITLNQFPGNVFQKLRKNKFCILRRHEQTGDFSRYAANTNTEDLNYSVQTINRKYKKFRDGKFLQKKFQIKLFFNSLFYFFSYGN